MKVPPLLIAAAAAFWGVENGHLIIGLICAAIIGGVTVIPIRWEMSDEDCVRVSDLTSVIFLSAAALILLNVETVVFLKTVVIWQPPVLLPLVCAQLYSGREKIIIGTRLGLRKKKIYKHNPLDFKVYYLAVCLLSAAMANSRSLLFFPGAALICFWLLLVNRGRAYSRLTFIAAFLIALGGGFLAFKGAEVVHGYAAEMMRHFYRGYLYSRYADPFQARLSYGTIGRLKTSGKIILRLKTEDRHPSLLRQASYELFQRNSWHSDLQFHYPALDKSMWQLMPRPRVQGKHAVLELNLPKEKGLLPYLYGSYQVLSETIFELEQKDDGILRIVDGAPLVIYELWYDAGLEQDMGQPSKRHLAVTSAENQLLDKVMADWQIKEATNIEKVQMVKAFFASGFTYSLDVKGAGNYSSPLENFLRGTHEGYCELFATATALLLRKAGVPSRYVTGFAVSEKSWLEEKYIVRERHAHAWSEAYVDGRWIVVDTTPADWLSRDSDSRSAVEPIMDLLSYVRLKYEYFRIQTEQKYKPVLSVVMVVLAAILIFRIYRRMRAKRLIADVISAKRVFKPVDSPMYRIEQKLAEIGITREINEPFLAWAYRINATKGIELATIETLYKLHMKLRFDPVSLKETDQGRLEDLAGEWLAHYGSQKTEDRGQKNLPPAAI